MRNTNGEGYVGKLKDGRWTSRIQQGYRPDGKPKIKAFYGKTQKEARKKLRDFLESGGSEASSPELFGDYFYNWFLLYKKNDLKASTFDKYEDLINKHILPQLGHIHISVIGVDHFQRFFNYMVEQQYSEDYVRKAKYLLNNCMSIAEFSNVISKNPMRGIVFPRKAAFPKKKEINFLTEADIRKFREEASSLYSNNTPVYRYGHGVVFILYTGLRCGEALNLRWKDINMNRKTVKVSHSVTVIKNREISAEGSPKFTTILDSPTKTTGSVREVNLCRSAIEAIENHKTLLNPTSDDERVFATINGNVLSKRNLYRTVESISSKAGLSVTRCNVHDLRHTFASMAFRRGVDVKTVSALLGHSSVKLTYDIYVHLFEEQKKEAIALLDEL